MQQKPVQTKSREIKIELETANPQASLFFNDFTIDRNLAPDHIGLGFAFIMENKVVDQFFCLIPKLVIASQKQNFLQFLTTFGKNPPDIPAQNTPFFHLFRQAYPVDLIGLAKNDTDGEICFHSFSWKIALDNTKLAGDQTRKNRATFVALLRCPAGLLKNFVLKLYADENPARK